MSGGVFALNGVNRWAVLAAAVASLSVGLLACGGGSGTATPAPTPPTEVPLAAWALKPVTDAALVEQLRTALSPANSAKAGAVTSVLVAAAPSVSASAGSSVADAGAAVSATVLQEAGVDEADLVKSDGQSVFSV